MMDDEDNISADHQNFASRSPKIRKLDSLPIDKNSNPASLSLVVEKGHKSTGLSTVGEKTSSAAEHVPKSCPEESILSTKVSSKDSSENENYVTAVAEASGELEENNESSLKNVSSMNILPFCNLLGKLKHLPRTGWLKYKLNQHPEPVAGHMYRMAILAFCLDDHVTSCNGSSKYAAIDKNKCIKMALVHDMAESIVGDITPHCGISPEEKYRRENEAMQQISTLLPGKIGNEMYDLWREYESQSSPEANLVKQLDKFDLIAQAYEYELENQKPKYLQEFFNSTTKSIKNEPILSWSKYLLEDREKWSAEQSNLEPPSTSDSKN